MRLAGLVIGLAALTVSAAAFGRASSTAPCASSVRDGVLPSWMRAGFSDPKPRIPYVVGRKGAIGGVIFGAPLNAPPAQHKSNKVLWVARHWPKTIAPLWIRMQQMEGTRLVGAPIRQVIATGPGPSYVDAPAAGCWRVTLTWSGRRDTLDLAFVPPTN